MAKCQRAFTLLAIATALSAMAASARADRVVLLPAVGDDASDTLLERVDGILPDVVRAVGHTPVTERAAWDAPADVPPPRTANELRTVAEIQGAEWAVVPKVRPAEGGYWLTLRVGYGPEMRVELITTEVLEVRERDRLTEVLAALLRPEGVGADAPTISGPDEQAREADRERREAEERAQREAEAREAEERAQQEAEERADRERREAEERAQREAEAKERWETRERYGERGNWLVQAGLGVRPLVSTPEGGTGGALGAVELRGGHVFDAVPGLEVRGGVDIVFGAVGGFSLYGGAAYLGSYFADLPIFIGPSVELGLFHPVTGARTTSFMLRGSPVIAWRPTGALHLEAAVLEVTWLSARGGAVTLGFSARVGVRF
jgi:hypothetical protein